MKDHDCSKSYDYNGRACGACRQAILDHADAVLRGYRAETGNAVELKDCGCATAACEHMVTVTIGDTFPGELSSAEAIALGVNFNIEPERFGRASWDIPTSFSPRLGTLAR